MPHDDVRQVGNHLELFQGGKQITIAGDPIPQTVEEMSAIRDALYEETTFGERYVFNTRNFEILGKVSAKLNRHAALPTAITKGRLFAAYQIIDAAGGMTEFGNLERVPEEIEAPAAPLARDEAGRFQNQYVAEYEALVNNASVHHNVITERLRTDRAFREAVEASRLPKPTPRTEEAVVEDELGLIKEFAKDWQAERSPHFIAGYVRIGQNEYTPAQLEEKLAAATRLGLLR